MERRTLLKALALAFMARQAHAAPPKTMKDVEALQKDWKTFLPTGAATPSPTEPVKLSKDEWRKKLPGQSYSVLREESTERAGTSPLNNEKRAGIFACAGCDLPLFTSDMKFDSGTGWPSFFTSIPGVFETKSDRYLIYERTEYHCKRCGGHHGHLFDDGPPPTGLRYCNNGVALKFIPRDAKA
ncbi:MAG: peptide-methionine (R)-S-oxide reductase MsrB [Betaproteobacteria bacterium]|nr:peptide-methionine (R)-S-oxide reductase MsrB [Betaproteobacteria bacterium]MBV9362506.1 peptide-methionine (R)-S-oxide reductase MsrB [Betaproteobacteria bacterium]